MQNWKCTLAYDGSPYHGWQIQPSLPTVQGTLAHAIQRITGESVLPQGSGRTDAGVHALAQVASFALQTRIPSLNLLRALNHSLPASIRILSVGSARDDFHARHSALRKTYEYRIFPAYRDRICPPFLAPWVWACPFPLDLVRMKAAAQGVLGTHDFTSFAAVDPDHTQRDCDTIPTNLRTILHSCWQQNEDGLLIYRVTGSGFLHHMVRNLVGTFVDVGAARIDPASMAAILAARSRAAAGPTAPAQGLFLVGVEYPA